MAAAFLCKTDDTADIYVVMQLCESPDTHTHTHLQAHPHEENLHGHGVTIGEVHQRLICRYHAPQLSIEI